VFHPNSGIIRWGEWITLARKTFGGTSAIGLAAILYFFSTRFNASSTALLCGSRSSDARYSSPASENLL
jgi:hypothetical protein